MKRWLVCIALLLTAGARAEVSDEQAERNMKLALKEIAAKRAITAAEEELQNVTEFALAFATLFSTADGELCQLSFESAVADIEEAKKLLNSIEPPTERSTTAIEAWNTAKSQVWSEAIALAEESKFQCTSALELLQQHLLLKAQLDALVLRASALRQLQHVDLQRVTEIELQLNSLMRRYYNAELGIEVLIEEIDAAISAAQDKALEAKIAEQNAKHARKRAIRGMIETSFLILMVLGLCYRATR